MLDREGVGELVRIGAERGWPPVTRAQWVKLEAQDLDGQQHPGEERAQQRDDQARRDESGEVAT